ncbi:MAG TPA: MBL fold metallo-hydrolase, partial [Kofleriaceae bacterium]|nr:MBL fold metallo-hydrolase [Kofleriaceae bacterium]
GAALLAEVTPIGHVALASATAMAVLTAVAVWLATRDRHARGRGLAWIALCLVWGLAGRAPPPAGALRVTFLDVGQGDAALVELPDGAVWLIDAGGAANAAELAQAAAPGRAVDRVLAAYDHTRIDLAVISHPHPDHYLGLAAITAPITELWAADEAPRPPSDRGPRKAQPASVLPGFAAITAGLAARGTRLVHPGLGVVRREAGVELAVWAPRFQPTADAAAMCAADPVRTVNDNSLVVAVRFAGRTILFAGDLEAEGEDDLIAAGLGAVDVVKVAHHGSPTSSTPRFVAHTRPRLAVISCGRGNAFGFPAPAVIARWLAGGAAVARTDRDGAITVTVDRAGDLAVDRFVPAPPP